MQRKPERGLGKKYGKHVHSVKREGSRVVQRLCSALVLMFDICSIFLRMRSIKSCFLRLFLRVRELLKVRLGAQMGRNWQTIERFLALGSGG